MQNNGQSVLNKDVDEDVDVETVDASMDVFKIRVLNLGICMAHVTWDMFLSLWSGDPWLR